LRLRPAPVCYATVLHGLPYVVRLRRAKEERRRFPKAATCTEICINVTESKFWRARIVFVRAQKRYVRAQKRCVRAQKRCVRAQKQYVRAQKRCVRAQMRCVRAQMRYVRAQMRFGRAQMRFGRAQMRFGRAQKQSGRAQKRSGNSLNHLGIAIYKNEVCKSTNKVIKNGLLLLTQKFKIMGREKDRMAGAHEGLSPSCRICSSADESISICNAKKTADIFDISGKMMLRITNAYSHDCRIANSAGRSRLEPAPSMVGRDGRTWRLYRPPDCHVATLLAKTGGCRARGAVRRLCRDAMHCVSTRMGGAGRRGRRARRPSSPRYCEEQSDAAIRNTLPCAPDGFVTRNNDEWGGRFPHMIFSTDK
jgi:hypothetical protein